MARILGVGIATVDIVNIVDHYPSEDEELRALSQHTARGGNVTNTLVILAQAGHQCDWLGTLADEPDSTIVTRDLDYYAVNYSLVKRYQQGKTPTSYITLNQRSGSRTIVHYRNLDELQLEDFDSIKLQEYDWIHFEGRNVEIIAEIIKGIRHKVPTLRISLEVEKPRQGIEELFNYPDLILFSKHYAIATGYGSAQDLLTSLKTQGLATCTWGEEGAYGKTSEGHLVYVAAKKTESITDTIGAGDTFNAGIIDSLLQGLSLEQALEVANKLAAKKIQQMGFNNLF